MMSTHTGIKYVLNSSFILSFKPNSSIRKGR